MGNSKQAIQLFLQKSCLGRHLLNGYRWMKNPEYMRLLRRTEKGFKNAGRQAIERLVDIFEEQGIGYWLTFGTLLGAVREHRFLGHDDDIDVAIFEEEFSDDLLETLLQAGFRLYRRIDIYSKRGEISGFEVCLLYEHCLVDLFIFHKHASQTDRIYTHDFVGNVIENGKTVMFKQPRRLWLPWTGIGRMEMCGRLMNVPANYEAYLSAHYGENFMIPDPLWTNLNLTHAENIPDAVGIVTNY